MKRCSSDGTRAKVPKKERVSVVVLTMDRGNVRECDGLVLTGLKSGRGGMRALRSSTARGSKSTTASCESAVSSRKS